MDFLSRGAPDTSNFLLIIILILFGMNGEGYLVSMCTQGCFFISN